MPDKDLMLQRYEDAQFHNYNKNGLVIEEQIKLPGHSWNISDVKFNSSGLYLASTGWDKTTLVWDLKTLEDPKVLRNGHQDAITCNSWFPNVDTMLISGSSDKSMVVWNLDNIDEPMARLRQSNIFFDTKPRLFFLILAYCRCSIIILCFVLTQEKIL